MIIIQQQIEIVSFRTVVLNSLAPTSSNTHPVVNCNLIVT